MPRGSSQASSTASQQVLGALAVNSSGTLAKGGDLTLLSPTQDQNRAVSCSAVSRAGPCAVQRGCPPLSSGEVCPVSVSL